MPKEEVQKRKVVSYCVDLKSKAYIHKKGLGTSAYRNRWHVLDQMYMTPSLLEASPSHWRYWKAEIFNPPQLIHSKGPCKGTPFRSFSNGKFTGGYSDHFPVCLYLLREKN